LRGIDLPSIFLCVVLALGVLVVLILSAVLFAAFPASKLVRALVGLLAAGMLIPVCTMLNTGAFGIVSSGVAASLGSTETLRVIAIGFCLWLSVVLGLHAFAVAALSPPSADRMRLVRITATALWVLWGVGLAIATSVTSDSDYAESWVAASLLALAGFAIQATSERPALGRRILARTPDGTLRRLAAFPFATGQVQALTWVLLLLGATLLVGRSVDQSSPAGMGALDAMKAFSTMVVAYALSVTLLWRLLLRRLMSSEHLWGVTVLAILAGGIVPTLVEIFASDGADGWLFGNIFEAGNADALPLALGWCALATALFSPFVVRAFTVFRPPQEPIVPR
jgi:hypothetical protein